jgi:hypothetical protein
MKCKDILSPVFGNKIAPPGIYGLSLIGRECMGLLIYFAKDVLRIRKV